jgi:hypothetical protein
VIGGEPRERWHGLQYSTSVTGVDGIGELQLTVITSSDTQDDLTDVDTGNSSVGLTPGTTHSSLQSIGTGTRQHLVDTDDVVWVGADTKMETFLSSNLDQVPVKKPVSLCKDQAF